jgi:hypothetical protein
MLNRKSTRILAWGSWLPVAAGALMARLQIPEGYWIWIAGVALQLAVGVTWWNRAHALKHDDQDVPRLATHG